MKRIPATILAMLLSGGCATTSLPPVMSKDYIVESDEKNLSVQAGEIDEAFQKSGLLYADDTIGAYLNGVAEKLATPEMKQRVRFRVYVVKNPHLNAFALPNGALYIHTGILARMENEAQLATLLAHEMTHTTHRHAVRRFRDVKNKSAWFATTVAVGGDIGILLGGLGTMAAVTGYSRDLETEADVEGLKLVIAAGYDPRESPKLFEHLKKELQDEKIREPFFFGTHPRLQERIDNFESLLKEQYKGLTGVSNPDPFLAAVKGLIFENAQMDLKMGRFQVARREAEKYLTFQENDARGHHLLGEVFRQRGEKDDEERAIAEYVRAVDLDPFFPDPHKCLGLMWFKKGEKEEANKHFVRYLALSPQAPDRKYIEEYMKEEQ